MVNSTAIGGGVAECLKRVVPLLNDLEIPTKWEVMRGEDDFFVVTKAIHNALHGEPLEVTSKMWEVFQENTDFNAFQMSFDEDIIVVHDPQPLGLIKMKRDRGGKWVWRCHIDISRPDQRVWDYLRRYVMEYDASIFSSPTFAQKLPIPQYMIFPSIDPLAEKNRDIPPEFVDKTLERFGIDKNRPIITQISRFDRLKDPLGVIKAYKMAKKHGDSQLVLAGGGAADDPEGAQVLQEVKETASEDPDIHVIELPPFSDLEINALQRASTIILQKSLREGFGLTISEALWKKKPVIASDVGGIPVQVIHNLTGLLVHSIDGAAYYIRYLLRNPDFARKLGENGHEYVKGRFIVTRNLMSYLSLFIAMDHPGERIIYL